MHDFLLSNDDGIFAPGLKALRAEVSKFGRTLTVAPHVERSASSHSISTHVPLRIEMLENDVYSVQGTPADCTMLACRKLITAKPKWMISGINRGGNLGDDTLYSGTVAAAVEACLHHIRAMAVSIEGEGPLNYEVAARAVGILLKNDHLLGPLTGRVLNVNVPNIPFEKLKGFAFCHLGRRVYEKIMHERSDPRGHPYYWIGAGSFDFENIPGSDCNYLSEGFVTLTVIKPDFCDLSETKSLRERAEGGLCAAMEGEQ